MSHVFCSAALAGLAFAAGSPVETLDRAPVDSAPATEAAPPARSEAAPPRASTAPSLGALRAGARIPPAPLGPDERQALRAAEQRSGPIGDLRAGDLTLTDHELKLVLITAGIVALIVLIA